MGPLVQYERTTGSASPEEGGCVSALEEADGREGPMIETDNRALRRLRRG